MLKKKDLKKYIPEAGTWWEHMKEKEKKWESFVWTMIICESFDLTKGTRFSANSLTFTHGIWLY